MVKHLKTLIPLNQGIHSGYLEETFAVKKDKFNQVGGFDANYIGNAMLEDSDFSFMISRFGGKLVYNPEPVIEHLRIPTGGTRKESASKENVISCAQYHIFFEKT